MYMADQANNNNNNTSGGGDKLYKGVRKRKWGKWVSEVRLPNSRDRIWLGSFDSPLKAARAFDAALYCLRGCRGNFNFPDTPLNLDHIDIHRSFTAHEIQLIAAKFANECPDTNTNQQEQQHHRDSSSIGHTSNNNATDAGASNNMMQQHEGCEGDMMDWTFLKELGDSSSSSSGDQYYYGLYSHLDDKFHSGELLFYSTTSTISPPPHEDHNHDDDPFSHQPFLWDWKF